MDQRARLAVAFARRVAIPGGKLPPSTAAKMAAATAESGYGLELGDLAANPYLLANSEYVVNHNS